MTPLELKALNFATDAHRGQVRKYTGEPYIEHPIAVVALLRTINADEITIAAAYLHDVVEDTNISIDAIRSNFGPVISDIVSSLTDIGSSAGNRATRKRIDRERLEASGPRAQTIKLADLIDNTSSIEEHDPKFAKVYMAEKRMLLKSLSSSNAVLWRRAQAQINAYYLTHTFEPRVHQAEGAA
jgi:(p)ppGpp synthase/HD superfamily hydrolase